MLRGHSTSIANKPLVRSNNLNISNSKLTNYEYIGIYCTLLKIYKNACNLSNTLYEGILHFDNINSKINNNSTRNPNKKIRIHKARFRQHYHSSI